MTKLIRVYKGESGAQFQYTIYYGSDTDFKSVLIPQGLWNKSVIINALIRSKYSQDQVEAIINNHFLNIAEWLDAKFNGSTDSFVDKEYDDFQNWRKQCKLLTDEALKLYPAE